MIKLILMLFLFGMAGTIVTVVAVLAFAFLRAFFAFLGLLFNSWVGLFALSLFLHWLVGEFK